MLSDHHALKRALLGATAAAALMLTGCGGDDTGKAPQGSSELSAKAEKDVMGDKSPIDKPFKLDDAEPLDMDGFVTFMQDGENESFSFAVSTFDESIGATVLTDVTTSDEESSTTIGRVELYGVNQDYMQRLKNEELSETKEQLFRKVRLFDLKTTHTENGGTFTIGAMEVDGLSFGGFTEEGLEAMEDGQQMRTVMEGIDLGGIYFKDMSIEGFEEEGTGISMNVADMRFGGFSGGAVGPMMFKNFDYSVKQSAEARQTLTEDAGPEFKALIDGPLGNLIMPAETSASIESMTFDGFSLAGLLPHLANEELPPLDADNLISFGKIEAKNAVTYINGKKAVTTGYSVMDPIEFAWLIPTRINSYSKDSVMDMTAYVPEEQTELMSLFTENGLDEVGADGSLLWEYDDKAGNAKFDYDANLDGLANIDLEFNTSGAELAALHAAGTAGDETAFTNVALDGFTLRIEDQKLLDVLFGVAALQTGQDAAQMRASAPFLINMGGAQFAQLNPAVPGYLEAISTWVTNGGTIEITIAPEEPVTLGAISAAATLTPQTLPDVLNLQVTHTE